MIPPVVLSVFSDFPHVQTVVWDGEVEVNGSKVGNPEIFEPLWDFFVETPHVRYDRAEVSAESPTGILPNPLTTLGSDS